MASRIKREVPVSISDVLDGLVEVDLDCLDRPGTIRHRLARRWIPRLEFVAQLHDHRTRAQRPPKVWRRRTWAHARCALLVAG
jgi:hypothetical protein